MRNVKYGTLRGVASSVFAARHNLQGVEIYPSNVGKDFDRFSLNGWKLLGVSLVEISLVHELNRKSFF